jgi:hypothetical protein
MFLFYGLQRREDRKGRKEFVTIAEKTLLEKKKYITDGVK